jgi:hypothetical protein
MARTCWPLAAAVFAAGVLYWSAPPAGATIAAQEQIGSNSLGFVSAAPNVTFNDTLNGKNQTATATQALDIGDARGSGAG